MNILIYYPNSKRTISIESVMEYFIQKKHKVFLLTHDAEDELQEAMKKIGIKTFEYTIPKKSSFKFYIKHVLYFLKFIKKHNIDIIYSHIQTANLITSIASIFTPRRIIICRHHSDSAYIDNNPNERRLDKIINFLGREFIVPGKKVFNQMVNVEKADPKKIKIINYGYKFENYVQVTGDECQNIRNKYQAKLLIVKAARLIPEKRHLILFIILNTLIKRGYDIKLLALSYGSEKEKLERYVMDNNLQNNIFLLGFRSNIMDYLCAADLVVHISNSEASNSVIKEAGILKKPVIVCNDVGDFDDYIKHMVTGIVIDKFSPEKELEKYILDFYHNPHLYNQLGGNLNKAVFKTFAIENVMKEYDIINEGI